MRRNVDLFAVAVIVLIAAVWSFVGHTGLAHAIASGQLQVPDRLVNVVVHAPCPLQFHRY
jgi:hypothetical protein